MPKTHKGKKLPWYTARLEVGMCRCGIRPPAAGKRTCELCLERNRWNKKSMHGMKKEKYLEMMEAQNGRCALCQGDGGMLPAWRLRPLAIDHCHQTGRIRGLLCGNCNVGIGHLKEDPVLLRKAAAYLESHLEVDKLIMTQVEQEWTALQPKEVPHEAK